MSTTREREMAVFAAGRAWLRAKGDRKRELAEQLAEALRDLDAPARPVRLVAAGALDALDDEQRARAIERRHRERAEHALTSNDELVELIEDAP